MVRISVLNRKANDPSKVEMAVKLVVVEKAKYMKYQYAKKCKQKGVISYIPVYKPNVLEPISNI